MDRLKPARPAGPAWDMAGTVGPQAPDREAPHMAYEQIGYELRDDVALVTLNRPERLNAWTTRMGQELTDAFGVANDDGSIGAIVVTGEGRGFCAGADIQDAFKADLDRHDEAGAPDRAAPDPKREPREPRIPEWVSVCRASKPLLAAVNGAAIGVGLTMILPFDFIVASDQAKLSCRFVKMGITPELASSHFLVSRMGWGAASDLALTGRIIESDEALALRLVDAVVPHTDLVAHTIAKARQFGDNPDPQLRMIKELLTQNAAEADLDEVQRREMTALATALRTPEHREAVSAFLEKRAPNFRS